MTEPAMDWDERTLAAALAEGDLARARQIAAAVPTPDIVAYLGRKPSAEQAVVFRLLAKDRALAVFDSMSAPAQAQLVGRLRNDEVATVFGEMDPDDRVGLLDDCRPRSPSGSCGGCRRRSGI